MRTIRVAISLAMLWLTAAGCSSLDKPSFIDAGEMAGVRGSDEAMKERIMPVGASRAPTAPAAAPAPPAALDAPQTTQPNTDARLVIYSAAFKVVVADVSGTLASIRAKAEQLGGHLQYVDGGAITVRVPAAKFTDAVAFVERVGEVVERQLRAQDVTEQMQDLRTHLDNFEKLRQRFQELLAKAQKVDEALRIEAELARVTEELDKTKGKIRFLESQIAMSSIRVELNSPVPQTGNANAPRLPFEWVSELGEGLVEGQVQQTVKRAGIFGHGPRFKPPAGFVRYYESPDETEAMDASGLRLRVLKRKNADKARLPFWSALVRKSLVERRAVAVSGEENGKDFYFLRATRDVGGRPVGYLLSLKRSDGNVVVFEAWGPRELIDQNVDALRASALSVDPK